jgi:predicted DNA-binding transcriptional regulator AlpA
VPTATSSKPKSQAAAARKVAALKAANAAKRRAPPYSTSIQDEKLKARIAADAYIDEQQREQSGRLLTKAQVLARVCVTFPTLWKMMRERRFPQARFLLNKTVWLEHEVDDWMKALPVRQYKE